MNSNSRHGNQPELRRTGWPWVFLFVVLGVALLLAAHILGEYKNPTMEAVALNLGIVLIAVPFVDCLWRLCGGSPLDQDILRLHGELERLSRVVDVIQSSQRIGL